MLDDVIGVSRFERGRCLKPQPIACADRQEIATIADADADADADPDATVTCHVTAHVLLTG
ncbi:hypothetical protein [Paraburkholderia xenovorans]